MYPRLVGRVIYFSFTRPDIAYVVSVVSQFMHSPRESHLEAAYRILRYLKFTLRKGILFKKNRDLGLEADRDANFSIIEPSSIMHFSPTFGYYTYIKTLKNPQFYHVFFFPTFVYHISHHTMYSKFFFTQ